MTFVAMKIAPGIYPDFPEATYHSDPCPAPSFSQSIGKVLIERSPMHAALVELVNMKLVEVSDRKRKTASGRAARVYIVPAGK